MDKKGQAAMEFLMTYGWAILVVLVAIGALAYFGFFDKTFISCNCGKLGLECVDYAEIDGTAYIQCRNLTPKYVINSTSITLEKNNQDDKVFICNNNTMEQYTKMGK